METPNPHLTIMMVSEFFYPSLGGVETHILQLSRRLIDIGYKVVGVTAQHDDRCGIRYLECGLKIYYLPIPRPVQVCLPLLAPAAMYLREIVIREKVDIIHGHQATSALAHIAFWNAPVWNCRSVYTDHSLWEFNLTGAANLNKGSEFSFGPCQRLISVSHTTRENLVLRSRLDPSKISVIPNALDSPSFTPDVSKRPSPPTIRVVVLSRMTFRKGVDLLVNVIPLVCRKCSFVEFVIGGDGPKRLALEEMRDLYRLHSKVHLLGAIPHDEVTSLLQSGHVFLNCSLTEAFCIAILEAASCGLKVVTTNVGGVPEILPPSLMRLCTADPNELAEAVLEEIASPQWTSETLWSNHRRVENMYSWANVAERTVAVYHKALSEPPLTLLEHLTIAWECGIVVGKLWCLFLLFVYLIAAVLELIRPRSSIERAVNLRRTKG